MINLPHDYEKNKSEFIAKFTLEKLFPDEFAELLKFEKPDWMTKDKSVGVEVTRIFRAHEKEDENFYAQYISKHYLPDVPQQKMEKFLGRGNEVLNGEKIKPEWKGRAIGFVTSYDADNYEILKKAAIKKYNRINSGQYEACGVYYLYLFWQDRYEDEIPRVIEEIKGVAGGFDKQFTCFFVDTNDFLFRYDMEKGCLQKYSTGDYIQEIVAKARETALNF